MYNLKSVLENEMLKILWDFKIPTDHLISARRPGLVIVKKIKKLKRLKSKKKKKENLSNSGFCRPGR